MHKEHAHRICKMHLNRPVRLQTRSGGTYEGTLLHVDSEYVYLQVSGGASSHGGMPEARGYYYPPPGYYNPSSQIMTLALFDLLAITLLLL